MTKLTDMGGMVSKESRQNWLNYLSSRTYLHMCRKIFVKTQVDFRKDSIPTCLLANVIIILHRPILSKKGKKYIATFMK